MHINNWAVTKLTFNSQGDAHILDVPNEDIAITMGAQQQLAAMQKSQGFDFAATFYVHAATLQCFEIVEINFAVHAANRGCAPVLADCETLDRAEFLAERCLCTEQGFVQVFDVFNFNQVTVLRLYASVQNALFLF
jgi:hypothetical protein